MYSFGSKKGVCVFLRRSRCVLSQNTLKSYCDKTKLSTDSNPEKFSSGTEVDYSQIVFRRAEPRDHEDVIFLCKGALGGRDVLPAKFLNYLKDPRRAFFVADYKGKVVATIGGRILDDGNSMEGSSGRSLPELRGLYTALRVHLAHEWVMKEHPKVTTFLGVVRHEKAAFDGSTVLAIPVIRDIIDLAWKVPITAVTKAIDMCEKYQTQREQQSTIHNIDKGQLSVILDDSNFRKYFPNGFIVVDSSPFQLNYKGNLDIIVHEDKRVLFASYNNEHSVEAISLGTAVEMGTTVDTLRYAIDYYGIPSLDSLIVHTMKHISKIPALFEQSQTASVVYIAIFLVENSVNQSVLQEFVEFISTKLCLDNRSIKIPTDRQFILKMKKLDPKL